ncbi:MAG: molybdenum cofactor biosynthesis protein MoaE [Candidatus Bathyarchaeia archaeon]
MTKTAGVHEKGTVSLVDVINSTKGKRGFRKAGAIAVFIGVVRGEALKGEKVQRLELQAYQEKADQVLTNICDDLKRKPGIVDVQIHHLLGEFHVGEDIVYVLVTGSHREEVFPVLEEAVERYKKDAPIFKKESVTTVKGEKRAYWLEERESHR